MLNNTVTLKSGLKVIETGAIEKLGCGFLSGLFDMALKT